MTKKPKHLPHHGWTVVRAEGPTWLIIFAFVVSIATVIILAIILGGGFD